MRTPDRRLVASILVVAGLSGAPAAAETPEEQLDAAQKALAESRERAAQYAQQLAGLAAEIATLRGDSIAAAKAAQEQEAALSALEEQLRSLNTAAQAKGEELKRRREQQAQLLMALERLARNPPEGLALAPGPPADLMRSAALVAAAVPPIEAAATALRRDLQLLADLRRQIAETELRRRAEWTTLEKQRADLALLIAKKAQLLQQAQQGAEQTGQREIQLAAQVVDLSQLVARLEAERKAREAREAEAQKRREEEAKRQEEARRRAEAKREAERQARANPPPAAAPPNAAVEVLAPPPVITDPSKPKQIRPFAKARGLVLYPVTGHLLRHFGDNDEYGVASKGLTLETRPAAQVVAPFDGKVAFAGPFRGYGQILIIEHGDGYHSLLSGLDHIEGTVGQWLVAGEPVGTMPRGEDKPRLYLELRHDGQPINPVPWLATRDEKVSG